jgi:hypothetical protein
MSRILVVTVLLAGLTAVATSLLARAPADPVVEKKPAVKEQAAAKDALPTPQSLIAALTAPVTFAGERDPSRTLVQVLDDLSKQHHVSYTINDKAFKYEMLNDVGKSEIANPEPLPRMRTTLGKVITRILGRLPVPSGATFLIRDDGIEITTNTFVAAEITVERQQPSKAARPALGGVPAVMPPAGGGLPGAAAFGGLGGLGGLGGVGGLGGFGGLGGGAVPTDDEDVKKFSVPVVSVAVERQPLEEAIRQIRSQTNANFVLDPGLGEKARAAVTITLLNSPLDSALRVLMEMTELEYVWLDNIFYITTREKGQKLRSTWPARHSGGGPPVLTGAGAAGAGM